MSCVTSPPSPPPMSGIILRSWRRPARGWHSARRNLDCPILADPTDIEAVLSHPDTARTLDLGRPLGIIIGRVAHVMPALKMRDVVAVYLSRVPAGSWHTVRRWRQALERAGPPGVPASGRCLAAFEATSPGPRHSARRRRRVSRIRVSRASRRGGGGEDGPILKQSGPLAAANFDPEGAAAGAGPGSTAGGSDEGAGVPRAREEGLGTGPRCRDPGAD